MSKTKEKNVTLICPSFRFSKIEYFKPPFYVMKYLKEIYGVSATIVFDETLNDFFFKGDNKINEYEHNGIELVDLSSDGDLNKRGTLLAYKDYIKENAKEIDLLLVFHANRYEVKLCNLYKKINPKGKVMTIMDHSTYKPKVSTFQKLKALARIVLYHFDYKRFARNCDKFSVETEDSLEYLKHNKWNGVSISKKVELLPFGYDKKDFGYIDNERIEKENIFLTVGRIGTAQKNSELILDALKKVDLKDWKFIFVGPIETSFKQKIDEFNAECPEKRRSVIFTGSVTDRRVLAEYYKRASVFVLSSENESFGLVLVEALLFQNFILSTPVGVARDLEKQGVCDLFDNSENLLVELQMIVDGKIDLNQRLAKKVATKYDYQNLISNFKFFNDVLK